MKDKNAPRTSRQKSAQQEELNEIIEENDTNRKDNTVFQQKDNNNPYENYKFGNESPNRKSKFSSLKTLDERKLDPKFSKKIEG